MSYACLSFRPVLSEASFPAICRNLSFAFFSNRFAQTNSVARIASPTGMTMKAGPGRTIITIPIINTVKPIMAITNLLACLMLLNKSVFIFLILPYIYLKEERKTRKKMQKTEYRIQYTEYKWVSVPVKRLNGLQRAFMKEYAILCLGFMADMPMNICVYFPVFRGLRRTDYE